MLAGNDLSLNEVAVGLVRWHPDVVFRERKRRVLETGGIYLIWKTVLRIFLRAVSVTVNCGAAGAR